VLLRQKERVAKAYNKKVKSKSFNIADFVWKIVLPMDKIDIVLGGHQIEKDHLRFYKYFQMMHMR
jgi:hypothetical protein